MEENYNSTSPLTFTDFLEKMKDPAAADLVKAIKAFIASFKSADKDLEASGTRVRHFLASSDASFRAHPLWAGSNEAALDAAGEGLEKYIMTKLYDKVFRASEEDREGDEILALHMRALEFLRPEHLDIPNYFRNDAQWTLAQKELQKINSYKAPRDKLICILNCCRVITNLLNARGSGPSGADDFFPVLVYITIRTNPPNLKSNLEYIRRHGPDRNLTQPTLCMRCGIFTRTAISSACMTWLVVADACPHVKKAILGAHRAASVPSASQSAPSLVSHQLCRFRAEARLVSEAEYLYTNMVSAAQFVELINPDRLSIDKDVFLAHMIAAGVPMGHLQGPGANGTPIPASPVHYPASGPYKGSDKPAAPGLQANAATSVPSAASIGAVPEFVADLPDLVVKQSAEHLERHGASLAVEAAGKGELSYHRFLHSQAGDLTLQDVKTLLTEYKELVLKYETLRRAVDMQPVIDPAAMLILKPASEGAVCCSPESAAQELLEVHEKDLSSDNRGLSPALDHSQESAKGHVEATENLGEEPADKGQESSPGSPSLDLLQVHAHQHAQTPGSSPVMHNSEGLAQAYTEAEEQPEEQKAVPVDIVDISDEDTRLQKQPTGESEDVTADSAGAKEKTQGKKGTGHMGSSTNEADCERVGVESLKKGEESQQQPSENICTMHMASAEIEMDQDTEQLQHGDGIGRCVVADAASAGDLLDEVQSTVHLVNLNAPSDVLTPTSLEQEISNETATEGELSVMSEEEVTQSVEITPGIGVLTNGILQSQTLASGGVAESLI